MVQINGPLKVHPDNPRYFTDYSNRAIYLTGSHTWANLQDMEFKGEPEFHYDEYLDFLAHYGHNWFRLWMFENAEGAPWTEERISISPLPYVRCGPGRALDMKPKFDLDQFNEEYFTRLRQRIESAGRQGVYVSIMLFQGWSLNRPRDPGEPWRAHPFNPENNLQGIGSLTGMWDEESKSTLHSLGNPAVITYQERYVQKVIDTVNDLDNVMYEIINEGGTKDWQYHFINFIHAYEAKKAKQHPVGMTPRMTPIQHNNELFDSPADWISPTCEPWPTKEAPAMSLIHDYRENPPLGDGRKVIISDTDHLWGHGGNYRWVWKSFLRGLNPVFMDPWCPIAGKVAGPSSMWASLDGLTKNARDYPEWEPVRLNMGYTRRYAERIDLANMIPHNDLASSYYCLANPGKEYLVYLPEGQGVTVDLRQVSGTVNVEWFFPALGRTVTGGSIHGGAYRWFPSHYTGDALLYLK